jgi:hypothetical protein
MKAASKAKPAVRRSPYAAGTAKTGGTAPPITCGSRTTSPADRNVCSRTSGSSACTRGCFDRRGTIYQTMMSVKESRLTPTLSRNASKAFIDVLLEKCKP